MTRLSASSPSVKPAVSSATMAPTGAHVHAADSPSDQTHQHDTVAEVIPTLSAMSLAGDDTTDRGRAAVAARREARPASPAGQGPIVPQTVVNITVHAHNSPVHIYTAPNTSGQGDGARIVGRVLSGPQTVGHIEPPRRVLRPIQSGGMALPPSAPASATGSPAVPPVNVGADGAAHGGAVPVVPPASAHLESLSLQLPLATSFPSPPEDDELEGYEHIAPANALHIGKWYAVVAGRKVGVWADWLEMGHFVLNVPGNQHKSFRTRAEALQWYFGMKEEGNVVVIAA